MTDTYLPKVPSFHSLSAIGMFGIPFITTFKVGKEEQRRLGLDVVFPKSEVEDAAAAYRYLHYWEEQTNFRHKVEPICMPYEPTKAALHAIWLQSAEGEPRPGKIEYEQAERYLVEKYLPAHYNFIKALMSYNALYRQLVLDNA